MNVVWTMVLDIPSHSLLYAHRAYDCFDLEDVIQDESIHWLAKRGSKAKNRWQLPGEEKKLAASIKLLKRLLAISKKCFLST